MSNNKLPTQDEYFKGISCDRIEKVFQPVDEFNFKDAVAAMIQIYAYHGDCIEFKHLSEIIGIYLGVI